MCLEGTVGDLGGSAGTDATRRLGGRASRPGGPAGPPRGPVRTRHAVVELGTSQGTSDTES